MDRASFPTALPLPPSAINGESADRTAPVTDEDDLNERERERDSFERRGDPILSPLKDLLCLCVNLNGQSPLLQQQTDEKSPAEPLESETCVYEPPPRLKSSPFILIPFGSLTIKKK